MRPKMRSFLEVLTFQGRSTATGKRKIIKKKKLTFTLNSFILNLRDTN
ncbi:hypothetical protein J2T15_002967 [Paenibacillus harenae]|uniref:Uncharacterized protein n=1 Tax=Paenibacillus harenae TaxID=306543 RepID=A0ABT9U1M2_PAEHA|nr:hypothetical protein [Paenibacillus harenae]